MKRQLLAAGWVFVALLSVSPVQGDKPREGRPLLLGGAVQPQKSPVRLDPVLPRGELLGLAETPLLKRRHCSHTRPVCVGSLGDAASSDLEAALELLVRAYEEHRFGAGMHSVRTRGGSPLFWLIEEATPFRMRVSRIPSRGFDRGRADCQGGFLTLEFARKCVAQAALVETAPATASWLVAGLGAHVSRALGGAPHADVAIAESLAHTQIGVFTSTEEVRSWRDESTTPVSRERSVRFFDYLESRSVERLGYAAWLSLSLAATETPEGAARFEAEPDLLDVLRVTLGGDATELARLLDDFAHKSVADSQRHGFSFEPDWVIAGKTLPRNLVLPSPLEPSGSGYVRVELSPEQREQVMAFKMVCEAPVSYVWSVARLDQSGNVISVVPVAYSERGRTAATRVEPEEGAVALLLAGSNLGGIDLAHPFDPDHEPHEAHACSVYVSPLQGEHK